MSKRNIIDNIVEEASAVLPDNSFKERVASSVGAPQSEKRTRAKKRFEMPKQAIWGLVATCLIVCVGLGAGLGVHFANMPNGTDGPATNTPQVVNAPTYVSVDINPSFGMEVDDEGKVIEVEALNEDGAVVLLGIDLSGMDVEDAFNTIIEVSADLGYLKAGGTVKVVACNDDLNLQTAINQLLQGEINANATLNALNVSVNIALGGKEEFLSALEEAGKTVENVANYTAEQLNKLLKDYDEEAINNYVASLTQQFETEMSALCEEMSVFADDIVTAYENHDFVGLAFALGNACEHVLVYLESKGVDTSIEGAVAVLLQHPEYVEEFCAYLEKFLTDGPDEDFVAMIESYVKNQIKEQE